MGYSDAEPNSAPQLAAASKYAWKTGPKQRQPENGVWRWAARRLYSADGRLELPTPAFSGPRSSTLGTDLAVYVCQTIPHACFTTAYSYRKAFIGSTFVARIAGSLLPCYRLVVAWCCFTMTVRARPSRTS